jgi:hypothetical protein
MAACAGSAAHLADVQLRRLQLRPAEDDHQHAAHLPQAQLLEAPGTQRAQQRIHPPLRVLVALLQP